MKTSEQILAVDRPELLFDLKTIKADYRKLAMLWHPDRSTHPDASTVSAHINLLYSKGLQNIEDGVWFGRRLLLLKSTHGTEYRIKYRYHSSFELGEMYVSDTVLVYVIQKKHEKYFNNAVTKISDFKFASDRMEKEMGRYLPTIRNSFETNTGLVLVIDKTRDVVPLRCLLNYHNGFIDGKHTAWIVSSLHNTLCYLHWSGLVHCNLTLDNYFVSYEHHTGLLLGGWWYSHQQGQKLQSVARDAYKHLPFSAIKNKTAEFKIDSELAKAIGRGLLGDSTGSSLKRNDRAPIPFINWLLIPGSDDALGDYKLWTGSILKASYGRRRFIKMDVSTDDVYNSCKEV